MSIELTCTHCGQALRAAERDAGKQGRCPSCKTTFAVPERSELVAEEATCHFCGAPLTAVERRLAESLETLAPRERPAPPSFPDHPELARLFPADRYGAYAMCHACRESAVQNEEELREEREAIERHQRGCLLAALVVAVLLLAAAMAFLYGSVRARSQRGRPAMHGRAQTATTGDRWSTAVYRIQSGPPAGFCPRTFMRMA